MDGKSKCEYCGAEFIPKVFFKDPIMVHSCNCLKEREQNEETIKQRAEKRKRLKSLYKKAQFTRKQRGKRIKRLSKDCEHQKAIKDFVLNFKPRKSKGLLLVGTKGNGKTTIANCIGKEAIIKDYSVISMTFAEYLNKMQNTYSAKDEHTFDSLLEEWSKKDIVIIDDFARERYTDKRLENTFLLFDKLYNECTTFIITANPENIVKIKEIPELEAVLDRIFECTTRLEFRRNSFRREE